jgi:hypothetical protein
MFKLVLTQNYNQGEKMENKCKCGESCDCVSREKYQQALKATAYLANRIKVLEEKYKLALFSSQKKEEFQPPVPPVIEKQLNLNEQDFVESKEGWGKDAYGKIKAPNNQIKIDMVNDLPPGVDQIKKIVLEDKDTTINDECEVCSA